MIGVALSFKVTNSRSWSKLEPADFRNGVRQVYREEHIGTLAELLARAASRCTLPNQGRERLLFGE